LKTIFKNRLKAFTLCAGFFSLVACREKSVTASNLIPEVDNIHTFRVDTLPMTIKSTYFDSLWTNNYTYPVVGIGGITDDAFFGKTVAGAYIQLLPPADNFSFGSNAILDSAVISLPYLDVAYGDTSRSNPAHVLHLKAYEITGDFTYGDGSRKYYAMDRVAYNAAAPIASANITMKSLQDSLKLIKGDSTNHLLRMRINSDFADAFMAHDSGFFANTATFQNNFKGIYIAPDTLQNNNTLAYFALTGGNSTLFYSKAQMEFYYHYPTDTALKVSFFQFGSTSCAFFNGIYRNYNGAPAQAYLNSQAADHDSLIIQGYPGFRSDLTIQLGNNIPAAVINKAALVVTALSTGDQARFSAPQQLILKALNDDGTERNVQDMLDISGSSNETQLAFVGGKATSVTIGGITYTQYVLNIPRELQYAVAQGQTQLRLRLLGATAYPGAFRMIGSGPDNDMNTRIKFDIIYTKTQP